MPLKLSSNRHGSTASSGADSTRSDNTIKPSSFPDFYAPAPASPNEGPRFNDSAFAGTPSDPFSPSAIAPWDIDPPSHSADGKSGHPASLGGFSFDGPGSPDSEYGQEGRRPSVASATTVSSTGSGSQGPRKKLQDFFGEQLPANSGNAPTSSASAVRPSANRMGSFNSSAEGQPTEVTPWMMHEPENPNDWGSPPDPPSQTGPTKRGGGLERQTTNPSKPSQRGSNAQAGASPASSKESSSSFRRGTRQGSTFPSDGSADSKMNQSTSKSPSNGSPLTRAETIDSAGGKRSIMDRLRGSKKTERAATESRPSVVRASVSYQQANKNMKLPADTSPLNLARTNSIIDGGKSNATQTAQKKEHHSRLSFKNRRNNSGLDASDAPIPTRDLNKAGPNDAGSQPLWSLDTDLNDMEGIVSNPQPLILSAQGDTPGWQGDDTAKDPTSGGVSAGAWDAPDSWAIKKVEDDDAAALGDMGEDEDATAEDDTGTLYCVRIFRVDSTFSTLSVPLNTTVSEIIESLGKKTFLQDDLDNYQIVMRRHGTSRQLKPNEKPLVIQKRLLIQAGYNDSDNIGELGRDDHSYLCRFTFLPSKMTGFASLEKDPAFTKLQKFSNLDLQGRNLVTIPIMLYTRATEIMSLNLSRNIALDVPRDFISSCVSLREIKYTGNEAWRLPPSLSLASRLTVLDVSNNRLEKLDDADLYKLENLVSLKLSNNRLRSLPSYFGEFKALRSLLVSSNSLTEFPDCLSNVKTLVDLDISFNSISSIPNIGHLEKLEKFWGTNNNFSGEFPKSIANCKSLREIDVRFNKIDNIDVMSQLPELEVLLVGHNQVTAFEGNFAKLRTLILDHNPVTRFGLHSAVPTLTTLNIASAKLIHLPEDLFSKMPSLFKLVLDKNHFTVLTAEIGKLQKLDSLSIAKNLLSTLPSDIGRLSELRFLDVRENNISQLPSEIWFCRKLETLNLSANVLDSFPKPSNHIPVGMDIPTSDSTLVTPLATPSIPESPPEENGEVVGDISGTRRMSQASGYFSSPGSSPATPQRKESLSSVLSANIKRTTTMNRNSTENSSTPLSRVTTHDSMAPLVRKDSVVLNRGTQTFAGSLRNLYLADNRLSEDVFDQLQLLPELRIVNLSFNEMYEIPTRTVRRWQHLQELYLSGNELTSLPAEDLEEVSSLRTLHINCNKFQTLPSELAKVPKLAYLDVGSNSLKYNVNNWPYDWNWNWNPKLKYLNFSGNKRLEIKPASAYSNNRDTSNLTDFSSLINLRTLGLMDVTLMVSSIPDETEDRRVRTSGSSVGAMQYGIADCLGNNEHLSTIDIVVPQLEGHDDQTLFGLFDGVPLSNGGSKLVKYLQENFAPTFKEELKKKNAGENAQEPLRRTYLALNKELASLGLQTVEKQSKMKHRGSISTEMLSQDDLESGCSATVLYLHGMDLFASNVGNTEALLISSDGSHKMITTKHDPASTLERQRIKEAGGYVSRQGKLNDVLDISRAFGFIHLTPSVVATAHVSHITLQHTDEIILLASRELWDYLTPDFAVDLARSERNDLMRAAQKLRDVAIAFGASGKMTVMLLGVSDLRKKERARFRTHSMSMGPSGLPDEFTPGAARRGRRGRDATLDSKLARLDQEVEAPTGDVSLVFTDIKSSTHMWETYPIAMRAAIKMHNEVMRRHLRLIGGYEVKTEGDAFMVSFPTVTSALLWCFTIQSQLLEVQWPQEILNSPIGQEVLDPDGNVLYRGVSVRMGIHYGAPHCETDPVTRRMDYFGPMVNRAARISSVADGGQITVSTEFISEVQRLLETHIESDRSNSVGSEDQADEDPMTYNIRRELRSLSSHGFEVKDLGPRRLKGLENPEYIYLMYPHSLAGRIAIQQQREDAEKAAAGTAGSLCKDSQLTIDVEHVWDLWSVSLRLEMLCSSLESTGPTELRPPERALLERTREKGGEITDLFLVNFIEHQISRIETCITTLALRNLVRPFKNGLLSQSCPMADIFRDLTESLKELQQWKEQNDIDLAPS